MLLKRAPQDALDSFHALCELLSVDPLMFVPILLAKGRNVPCKLELTFLLLATVSRDEMGWLPTLEGMSADPKNQVDEKWRKLFYLSSHKLAIHKKALAPLLFASTTSFLDLQESIRDLSATTSITQLAAIDNATKVLTLLNPHHYTAWNVRKRLILRCAPPGTDQLANGLALTGEAAETVRVKCEKELLHISLALSKQPKSLEAWAHRKWVLHTLERLCAEPVDVMREVKLCDYSINAHKRNYYAWSHRLYTLQHWIANKSDNEPARLKEELSRTWTWLTLHIADASAAHHCEIALRRALESNMTLLHQETHQDGELNFSSLMAASTKYLELYNAGETWWSMRRSLLSVAIYLTNSAGQDRLRKLLECEITFCASQRASETQELLSLRHLVWIVHYLRLHQRDVYDSLPDVSTAAIKTSREDLASKGWKAHFDE